MNNRSKIWATGLYLGLILVALPLVSILRSLQIADPGVIRNYALPILLLLFLLSFSPKKVLKPRTYLHYVLVLVFIQASIIGGFNLEGVNELRSYLSHLFQIASAYIMLGAGWLAINTYSINFWRTWAFSSLIAVATSTFLTLIALGNNDIGRLYTPAFALIFVMSFSTLKSKKTSFLSYALLIISNKRGPILSVIILHLYSSLIKIWKNRTTIGFLKDTIKIISISILTLILAWSTIQWAENVPPGQSSIATAINITNKRILQFINDDGKVRSLDELSSGRIEEINSALNSSKWWVWIIGSGAGWGVDIGRDLPVHNIHFSPLSIAMVFGAPFTIYLYFLALSLVLKYSSRSIKANRLSITEKMAPLYVIGGIVHSLTAYSLFIDLLFFFFLGVLMHSLSPKYRRSQDA